MWRLRRRTDSAHILAAGELTVARLPSVSSNLYLLGCLGACLLSPARAPAQNPATPVPSSIHSLADLQQAAREPNQVGGEWRLEAVVRAVVWERHLLALQDDSGAMLLELPQLPTALAPGDRVTLAGNTCRPDGSCQGLAFGGALACTVTGSGGPLAAPKSLETALAEGRDHQWVEAEGEVAFAGSDGRKLQILLAGARQQVPVTVVAGDALGSASRLHQHLRVAGICELAGQGPDRRLAAILVPSTEQLQLLNAPTAIAPSQFTNEVLTTAAQVRRLQPQEARSGVPARLRGVVIAAEPDSLVLQDASGGVFIHFDARTAAAPPQCGELWEVEGKTDPGDFSPVLFASQARFLGRTAMPEPIRPTWDQLMNGSLDAEYVELHGVLSGVSTLELTLLTPEGKVKILGSGERPLPWVPPGPGGGPVAGSLVRIRGCFTADWNWQTRQVLGGQFNLYPAVVEVEEPPPPDPFALPTRPSADLLGFDARASALLRTKIAGQLLHQRGRECFVLDGHTGLRVLQASEQHLQPGDLLEAVGFPKFGGASPMLQEALVRPRGRAPLPAPSPTAADDLLERHLDSTLIQLEATLARETQRGSQRVLELQAGPHRFAAILNADPRTWQRLASGSRLRLTGVYAAANETYAGANLAPFELLLNNAAAIVVLQHPPWWTLQRAIGVAAALAGTLGVAFVWITLLRRKVDERTAQLEQAIEARRILEHKRLLEQERTRVAQDLHDELGAGLTEVGLLGELAKNPAVPLAEQQLYLGKLIASARALVSGLDEIVWAVNPQYDSLGSLATYCSFFADRLLQPAGIACRLHVAPSLPECPLDSKVRHGLLLAFKEALNNVVRHAEATEVELRIEAAHGELTIGIRDNGRGLPPAPAAPASDGLSGMRQRLERLGGRCEITSAAGQGTTIRFRLPLDLPAGRPAIRL